MAGVSGAASAEKPLRAAVTESRPVLEANLAREITCTLVQFFDGRRDAKMIEYVIWESGLTGR